MRTATKYEEEQVLRQTRVLVPTPVNEKLAYDSRAVRTCCAMRMGLGICGQVSLQADSKILELKSKHHTTQKLLGSWVRKTLTLPLR